MSAPARVAALGVLVGDAVVAAVIHNDVIAATSLALHRLSPSTLTLIRMEPVQCLQGRRKLLASYSSAIVAKLRALAVRPRGR